MIRTSGASPVSPRPVWALPNTVTLAALLVLTLAACTQEPASAPEDPPPMEVVAYTVESSQVPVSRELTGRVVAAVTAEIRPQTGGIVRKRLFTEGSEVEAGQVLYEIDPTSVQTTVRDAEATLASAKVAVVSAKAKAMRYRDLVKIEAVSQESAEEAEAAYQQAVSAVDSAEANLESARLSLSYANVTSPISGRIGRSSVSEGALVTANQSTALATVQQLDPVYLDATQSAEEFLYIRQQFEQGKIKLANGDPVVRLIKHDGSLYESVGTLELADAIVDETTGTVTARSRFPNPNGELIPGMYGQIRLEGAVLQNALLVPQVAISRDVKGNALAYVIDENNTIEERTLTTGQTLGDQWVVESGLQAGERVVVEGLQKVQAGSVVSVAEETEAADGSISTSETSAPPATE
ncbi:efflux RND transporter periplasmic adaptor subunit [Marinobacter sp. AL4B]|uniref:efflux RND transporter periplasmic adaptor subunit n=1 Tax=Marinobacter sp. AL4B TaxID=2871173 RepID=UPI001CAA7EA3|nr:efflux RND transporter periplasmic adaptor subunit [Marinobacter sp. AL4B]MBZ0334412.1 efflux RND transporter periplasmic adaptor subunit [Marinobacter sp. AL4B]